MAYFSVAGTGGRFPDRFRLHTIQAGKNGSNLLSGVLSQGVVAAYIKEEVTIGWLTGPLPQEVAAQVHTSPIGVTPKGHTPGK